MKKFSIAVMWGVSSISPEDELEALWRLNDRCADLLAGVTPEVVLARWWDLDDREKMFRSFRGARKKFQDLQKISPSSYIFSLGSMGQGTSSRQSLIRDESRPQAGFSVTYESTSVDVGSFGRDLFEELVRERLPISASFEGFREHGRPAQHYCPEGYVWKLCDGLVLDSKVVEKLGGDSVLRSLAVSVERFEADEKERFLAVFDWQRRAKELEAVLRPLLAPETAGEPLEVLSDMPDDYDADQDPEAFAEFLDEWSEEQPVKQFRRQSGAAPIVDE
jgi:hypothetical protein